MKSLQNKGFTAQLQLFKLDFGNYILCLIKFYTAIFRIIILDILHRFETFCNHVMPITQESRITPTLSSMHPQMHTPISNYNIQQPLKKCKFL